MRTVDCRNPRMERDVPDALSQQGFDSEVPERNVDLERWILERVAVDEL
jgi:hypothetical protein